MCTLTADQSISRWNYEQLQKTLFFLLNLLVARNVICKGELHRHSDYQILFVWFGNLSKLVSFKTLITHLVHNDLLSKGIVNTTRSTVFGNGGTG